MTYSLQYRQRVEEIKESEGLSYADTSRRFRVGVATLFRWKKRIVPCKTRNKPATKINMEALGEDVRKYPDNYQWERAQRFSVTPWAIGVALQRLGVTYKKNSDSPQSRRKRTYKLPAKNKAVRSRRENDRVPR